MATGRGGGPFPVKGLGRGAEPESDPRTAQPGQPGFSLPVFGVCGLLPPTVSGKGWEPRRLQASPAAGRARGSFLQPHSQMHLLHEGRLERVPFQGLSPITITGDHTLSLSSPLES